MTKTSQIVPDLSAADERLSVTVLGMTLENPVLVASGAFSDSLQQIRRVLRTGAGGVVTKTIYSGQKESIVERVQKTPLGVFNSTTYSRVSLDRWLEILRNLAEENAPVVTSIFAQTPELLGELARRVVDTGSRALELGLSCPNDPTQQVADSRFVQQYTAVVRKVVAVPFSVKLSAIGNVLESVRAAIGEGADAISLSDALPSLVVDVEHRNLRFGGPVAYSGPPIKPIVLHSIYEVRKAGINCPILGIGGVGKASDVLEYLHVGAGAVQVYSILMTSGIESLSRIVEDLHSWCDKEGVTAQELVGVAVS